LPRSQEIKHHAEKSGATGLVDPHRFSLKGESLFSDALAARYLTEPAGGVRLCPSTPMPSNISCYKFAPLDNLKERRAQLMEACKGWGLKGTILLSPEGINLFVSGPRREADLLLDLLRSLPGLHDLAPKYSESDHQPFRRMLVRIKKEIIAFGVEGIAPGLHTSPKLPPRELKQWLDEGRPVTLLDTRNDYEVKLGTFKGALIPGIRNFRDFPEAVRQLPSKLREQPVVMFCTGGIRCEKAGPFMEREGFKNIFQLDGGILKYFEECGSAHYEGECFVFDHRVGVDPALRETSSALCFNCQAPLTEEEQEDPRYQPPLACPFCFKSPGEQNKARISRRQESLRKVSRPLPGGTPYDNERPLIVPPGPEATLLACLCRLFPHTPVEEWQSRCARGFFRRGQDSLSASSPVHPGERITQIIPALTEPPVNPDIQILHEDDAVIVLSKPAPLPMHPSGRFNRNTLEYLLGEAFHPLRIRPAHRLDANTTGLVVCSTNRRVAARLQPQFERGEVEKTYLARIQGTPEEAFFICEAPVSAEPGPAGSRNVDFQNGLPARTEFKVLDIRKSDGTTLLEARPKTGRTNQIRVHLWHLGFPVLGDPAYLPDLRIGDRQTLPVEAPPLCLHHWKTVFTHPATGQRISFEAPAPLWAASCGTHGDGT
jgi:RluA family pseudouridine synthase